MPWFILAAYAGATRRPLQTIVTLAIVGGIVGAALALNSLGHRAMRSIA
jgi:uncharacterized membrane protein YsdA (DUF1294 family)